ncbi:hypothetical protein, partial [Geobacillus stearothermophilus]
SSTTGLIYSRLSADFPFTFDKFFQFLRFAFPLARNSRPSQSARRLRKANGVKLAKGRFDILYFKAKGNISFFLTLLQRTTWPLKQGKASHSLLFYIIPKNPSFFSGARRFLSKTFPLFSLTNSYK